MMRGMIQDIWEQGVWSVQYCSYIMMMRRIHDIWAQGMWSSQHWFKTFGKVTFTDAPPKPRYQASCLPLQASGYRGITWVTPETW